jgi:hypothetical protein
MSENNSDNESRGLAVTGNCPKFDYLNIEWNCPRLKLDLETLAPKEKGGLKG